MPETLYILALDPSTDITGVALVGVDRDGSVPFIRCASFDGFEATGQPHSRHDLRSRLDRIAAIRGGLSAWIHANTAGLDLVAYEQQTERGHASTEAINMATGAYLTLLPLRGIPLVGIARVSACAAVGASGVYRERAGATAREKLEKRHRLKQAVIVGVNDLCGLSLDSDQDAEADAIAVGIAAGRRAWAELGAAQGKLKMRKGKAA